jgi:hypothetical protein
MPIFNNNPAGAFGLKLHVPRRSKILLKSGDGVVSEEEFTSACMRDDVCVMLLQKLSGEEVLGVEWGYLNCSTAFLKEL